ncbi:MAG: hypothetical protein H0W89_06765 [Candidatus Levybacteria bacterium]|nr:hypothetical protein [Candidatus Levybacteria bacterium]
MTRIIKPIRQNPLNIIDVSLSTDNASERGYRHIEDIPNVYQTLLDLLEYADKHGFKLGIAGQKKNKRYFGLYCKTRKTNIDIDIEEKV